MKNIKRGIYFILGILMSVTSVALASYPGGVPLLQSNNLSDVPVKATGRTNLGLGTAAVQNVGFFLQTANNLSDVTASTARTNLGLGTLATQDASNVSVSAFNSTGTTVFTGGANPAVTTSETYIRGDSSNASLGFIDPTRTTDAKVSQIKFSAGSTTWGFPSDTFGSVRNWLSVSGSNANVSSISIQGDSIALQPSSAGVTQVTVTGDTTAKSFTYSGSSSGSTKVQSAATASGTLTLPAATDTLIGKATTDILTNKTYDTAGTGNVFKINGTTISAVNGSGAAVLTTSPALTTPSLGAATATSINFGQTSLNAYQEGTWTPAVQFGGAAVGVTYSIQGGFYTVIGNRVFINMRVVMTSKGSSVGSATISGLPFTSNATSANDAGCDMVPTLNTTATSPKAIISPNVTFITLFNYASGALTALADTDFTNTSTIRLSCQYQK